MEDKSLDGIKKLSKDEIEKSREVILNLIGEKKVNYRERPPKVAKINIFNRKIDSLFASQKEGKKEESKSSEQVTAIPAKVNEELAEQWAKQKINLGLDADKNDFLSAGKVQKEKPRPEVMKIVPLKKIVSSIFPKRKIADINKPRPSVLDQTKPRIIPSGLKEPEKQAAQIKIKEDSTQKNLKVAEKLAQKKVKEIKKRDQAEYRRLKYAKFKKAAIDYLFQTKNFIFKQIYRISCLAKKIWRLFLSILVIIIFLYTVLAILVLKFNFQTNLLNSFSNYLPAFITTDGIINYNYYQTVKSRLTNLYSGEELEKNTKFQIIQLFIANDLFKKYGLNPPGLAVADLKELKKQIAYQIVLDPDINKVSLNRIKKIKEMTDNQQSDFIQIGLKYGDRIDNLDLLANTNLPYYQDLRKLNKGEISDIISTTEGYYLFRCYEKSNNQFDFGYIFVKARGFDDYIKEKAENYKILSLID